MTEELRKEIEDSIKKNLPQQVGETLQKELKELKDIREDNRQQEAKIKKQDARIAGMEETIIKLQKENKEVLAELADFFAREADLITREKVIYKLEAELHAQKTINEHTIDLYKTAFRNPVFQNNRILNERLEGYSDTNGNWVNDRRYGGSITEERKINPGNE